MQEFGADPLFQSYFYKWKDIVKLKSIILSNYLSGKDKEAENAARKLKNASHELGKMEKALSKNGDNIKVQNAQTHRIISQWSGRDSKKLSVFEFYVDVKDYEKIVEKENKKNG